MMRDMLSQVVVEMLVVQGVEGVEGVGSVEVGRRQIKQASDSATDTGSAGAGSGLYNQQKR